MLALILFIIFGLMFGYFATLNTSLVSIHFGTSSIDNVPIYLLVLASLGVGVVFGALFYSMRAISSWLAWGKKEKEISVAKKEVSDLTRRVHQLEIENAKLKIKNGDEDETDEESL
jgi:uncharacterized integral membrane protein